MIITSLLFMGTLVILGWTLMKMKELGFTGTGDDILMDIEPESAHQQVEGSGLVEARLQEICTQLSEMNQRLGELEKESRETMDKTQSLIAAPAPAPAPAFDKAEMEKFIQRVESRLELIAADKQAPRDESPDAVSRLEGKLEGIHKLLILLTDSGNPDQK